MVKKRVIKKFEQLSPELLNMVKSAYPDGFEDSLISFETPKGEIQTALPFETDDTSYLIKIPKDVSFEEEDNDTPANNSEAVDDGDFSKFDKLEVSDGEE